MIKVFNGSDPMTVVLFLIITVLPLTLIYSIAVRIGYVKVSQM